MNPIRLLGILLLIVTAPGALAQGMRPPPFAGGVPGRAQFDAITMQRHQARTLLYREALEELRKNPRAADLPDCGDGTQATCLTPAGAKPAAGAGGRRRALLIGNNHYTPPIPSLETPAADVARIAGILQARFGFETRIVRNAGQRAIIDAINRLAADTAAGDQVLIFYAGHGYLLDDVGMGYWIPADASVKTARGWISNSDIAKLLAAIPSRQLLLISDSCFSGTLTAEQKLSEETTADTAAILARRSVVVFSSGDSEPVSDEGKEGHSIFAWNLIRALESTGALAPGIRVWRTVHGAVTKDYPQTPQYGAVTSAGHAQGGDFLFLAK